MTNFLNNKECPMDKDGIIFNLKKGIEAEYRAIEACQNLPPLLDDEEDKNKISGIIQDERRHIIITEWLIEIVEKHYSK